MSTFMPTTVSNAAVIAVSGWKQSLGMLSAEATALPR